MALVVITGRAGKEPEAESAIVTVPTDDKKRAYEVAENYFRKHYGVKRNVALRSTTAFQGTEKEAGEFHERLLEKIKQKN